MYKGRCWDNQLAEDGDNEGKKLLEEEDGSLVPLTERLPLPSQRLEFHDLHQVTPPPPSLPQLSPHVPCPVCAIPVYLGFMSEQELLQHSRSLCPDTSPFWQASLPTQIAKIPNSLFLPKGCGWRVLVHQYRYQSCWEIPRRVARRENKRFCVHTKEIRCTGPNWSNGGGTHAENSQIVHFRKSILCR